MSSFQLHHTQMRGKTCSTQIIIIKRAFKDKPHKSQDHKPTQTGLTPWWIKPNEGKRPRRGFPPFKRWGISKPVSYQMSLPFST